MGKGSTLWKRIRSAAASLCCCGGRRGEGERRDGEVGQEVGHVYVNEGLMESREPLYINPFGEEAINLQQLLAAQHLRSHERAIHGHNEQLGEFALLPDSDSFPYLSIQIRDTVYTPNANYFRHPDREMSTWPFRYHKRGVNYSKITEFHWEVVASQ